MIRSILDYRISIQQLVWIAVLVAVPYLVIGGVWAANHSGHLDGLDGLDRAASFVGEAVAWPVLDVTDLTLR